MSLVSVLVGFLVGSVLGTIFSEAIAGWLLRLVPLDAKRLLYAIADSPRLHLRLMRDTDERRIAMLIASIFLAWEQKDLSAYAACWADDAIRITGVTAQTEERKDAILAKFSASCTKYHVIKVASLVFESISLGPNNDQALAHVRYRFELERARDQLPLVEDAREVYSLRRTGQRWTIAANMDHLHEIGSLAS